MRAACGVSNEGKSVKRKRSLRDSSVELTRSWRGALPAGGRDVSDGTLFQHRPAFHPPALPEGWLDDPDDCTVPEGADVMHSGG